MRKDIKQASRQRLEYIELMAYYAGLVTRSGLARAFGISDAAATKDLKLYGDMAPDNLMYKHNVFGFVPTAGFKEVLADLSPATVLPMLGANFAVMSPSGKQKENFGIPVSCLSFPSRLPSKAILAQITRAIYNRKKLKVSYHSLSGRTERKDRIIEPHSLANTGFRWHVRAYSEETFDFRDFVLSRFESAKCLKNEAESSAQYDDDWSEIITLQLAPHPKLDEDSRTSLLIDYGGNKKGIIAMDIRRSLIGYLLRQLSVDTTKDHSLDPGKHQLIVLNRDEIEPFSSWAFS